MTGISACTIRTATSGTPRPTHLDLFGLSGEVVELGQVSEAPAIDPALLRSPSHRPVAAADDIERAAKALLAARRPVIVAGDGAALSGCGAELLKVAEALAAPVATALGASWTVYDAGHTGAKSVWSDVKIGERDGKKDRGGSYGDDD